VRDRIGNRRGERHKKSQVRCYCEPASQYGNVFPPHQPDLLSAHQLLLSVNTLYQHNYKGGTLSHSKRQEGDNIIQVKHNWVKKRSLSAPLSFLLGRGLIPTKLDTFQMLASSLSCPSHFSSHIPIPPLCSVPIIPYPSGPHLTPLF